MDGLTDTQTVLKRCKKASNEPDIPAWAFISSKMLISLVFDESVTDGWTDRQTDGPTNRWTDPLTEMQGRI